VPIVTGVKAPEIAKTLDNGTALAERVLLRVEELELLVTGDRPRRLIELAQAELEAAVAEAAELWSEQEDGFLKELAASQDVSTQQAWDELRSLLARSARRAAEASSTIAARLVAGEDALAALGLHREHTANGPVRTGRRLLAQPPVLA
jgi:hypothetical protein